MSHVNSPLTTVIEWLRSIAPQGELFADSRELAQAETGGIFVAYPDGAGDGREYISDAIARGAKAVLYESHAFDWQPEWDLPHLAVDDLKNRAGLIADAFYGHPSASLFVVAVSGTNGKTSCSQWIGSALSRLGVKTAVIGTLGVSIFDNGTAGSTEETGYTTPDPLQLQRRLLKLKEAGVQAIAIEASSIGIEEGRLNGLAIDVVLFTNFSRDHLDYHESLEAYAAAKYRLFDWPGIGAAVINLDDEYGRKWAAQLQGRMRVTGYSVMGQAEEGMPVLAARHIQSHINGMDFFLETAEGRYPVTSKVVGLFNVSNLLGVMGVLLVKGFSVKEAISTVPTLLPPPGRMQTYGGKNTPLIVIDYAHTPDALEKGLEALRPLAAERKGKLWCVFGCGGDRDKGKRSVMGRVAERADCVIVTSDNPRSEEPGRIIEDIVAGMSNAPQIVMDRASAILQSVKQASANDVIFLAGKGHETYQEVKGIRHPFVDAEHAALALATFETMHREAV